MRKIATLVGTAVALFAIVAVAEAANVYNVTIASVTDIANKTKAGTILKPKPAKIKFGYTVANTDPSQRPSVTTDYDINFGPKIRQNRALFTAKNGAKFCTTTQAGYGGGSPNCPAGSLIGTGVVKNKFGPDTSTGVLGDCNVALTLFVGDGKLPPSSFDNDGKQVKSDMVLQLEGHPGGVPGRPDAGTCPQDVNKAAFPAQFVRKANGSTSLAFHVAEIPFQKPLGKQGGIENAVVDVSSVVNVHTVKVKTKVRKRVGNKFVFVTVTKTRGLFETVGCLAHKHAVTVTYTDKSGATNVAHKDAPCTP
jgi:hypothetical protein